MYFLVIFPIFFFKAQPHASAFIVFFYLGFLSWKGQQGKGDDEFIFSNSTRFTDIEILAGRLLQGTYLCMLLVTGLEPVTFGFRAQVTNR